VTKTQFTILNIAGSACALLIAADLALGLLNGRLNQSVSAKREQFSQAQQVQTTVQNLVVRIAQAGQSEPALRELLAKHEFKVNLNTNNPPQSAP
jgi:hypothetical protein